MLERRISEVEFELLGAGGDRGYTAADDIKACHRLVRTEKEEMAEQRYGYEARITRDEPGPLGQQVFRYDLSLSE